MFRRRFQSGTLGRSIRRFGRFPSGSFKRKQYSDYFAISAESAVSTVPALNETTILDEVDWNPGNDGTIRTGCRNVTLDGRWMLAWTPQSTTVAYDSWFWHCAIINCDADDVFTTMQGALAEYAPNWWDAQGRNTGEQPVANGISNEARHMNGRFRVRIPFIKRDSELRFIGSLNGALSSVVADMRLSLVVRIRHEIP